MSVLEKPLKDLRDRLPYPLQETVLHKSIVAVLRVLIHIFVLLEVQGEENLPLTGAVIVIANHLANFDIIPLQLSLSRPIFSLGKAELFQNPILHSVFRQMGGFPVYRGERDEWAILHSRQLLESGQVLGMFPEGTRSYGNGLKVAKTGAARLALLVNCPIVPVAIDGSQHFFVDFPHRTRIHVRICEPIYPKPNELPLALTDRLMFTLAKNLPENLRGVYSVSPEGFTS